MGERFMDEEITKPNVTQEGFAKETLRRQEVKKAEGAAEKDFFKRGEAKPEAAETELKSNVTREGFAKAVEARQKGKKIEKEAEQKAA